TKGVTKPGLERHMKGWRDLMMYFLVEQTQDCLELLEQGKDVVGVDYRREKNELESKRHYAGNFWWTTCKHLRTLTQPLAEPELWVCSRRGGDYHCLHESANDHYRKVYPAEAYR
ncbi:MAG: hypothetical protein L0170_05100, partial [Acidobacteria bacterium]|nr:hypothetical protein [Acidobacteriota bacterium]